MTDQDKYYKPEISEFHIGFEYELFYGYNWEKKVFDFYDFSPKSREIKLRVKKLDADDLNELGYHEIPGEPAIKIIHANGKNIRGIQFKKNDLHIILYSDQSVFIFHSTNAANQHFFNGTIRNKSELARILQMIEA